MNDHPPEYEYRVADLHDSTFSHPCGDDHEFAMIAAQRARALGRFGAQIQRRFMGPWHAMCDGDEAPAADRQRAVFDTTTWAEDGIMQTDLKYRGIVGVHEIHEPRGSEVRLLVDLDAPVIDAF